MQPNDLSAIAAVSGEVAIHIQGINPQADGSVLIDGAVSVCDLNRTMNWSLPDKDAATVAGLLIHEALAIPDVGQIFAFHGFRFEITNKLANRITALKLSPRKM